MVIRGNIKEVENINDSVNGSELERVQLFIYLGHLITSDDTCKEEVKQIIGTAKQSYAI